MPSTETDRSKLTVEELATRFRSEMIPVNNKFSYFSAMPIPEEDLKQYLEDPIAALPPAVCGILPTVGILLVPYLEKGNNEGGDIVSYEKPQESRQMVASRYMAKDAATLIFAVKDEEVSDYHYYFYGAIASLLALRWSPEIQESFFRVLREELGSEVHGEVDEKSWHLKQGLLRRQSNVRRETKLFREYAAQSFMDTLTLYLHGICCDIDVETGPRQMPSRYLRKRLQLLHSLFPPPEGYAVFPEDLKVRR
ncbi:MAG: hypothetical protein DMG57_03655 [Acidobacteria bacterium]|nr:MAG: hypothetical protein DMG57_03655 [Acidobacteriota bacterium]